jgi:predicted lipase
MVNFMQDSKDVMPMLAASKLAYHIKNGKLPASCRFRIDEWIGGVPYNWYHTAGFTKEVYTFTAGINNIHAGLMGISKNKLIIALRGTDGDDTISGSILDWLNNFLAVQIPFSYGLGNVHEGFYLAAESLKGEMIPKAEELYNQLANQYEAPEIILTGHSKGGAVATIMGAMLSEIHDRKYKDKITLYTFGAPRAGDEKFADTYRILTNYRYEAFLDIVCHLPLTMQEMTLLKRLGPVQELFAQCFQLKPYKSVGEGICIYNSVDNFGKFPPDGKNLAGETLNSFCAIEQIVRYGAFQVFAGCHDKDYYLLDKSIQFH